MLSGFKRGDITGSVGLSTNDARDALVNANGEVDAIPLNSGVYAIFNLDHIKDHKIRRALLLAIDRPELLEQMSVGEAKPSELNTPIAPGIYTSIDGMKQEGFNKETAAKLIGRDLKLNVVALADSDYEIVANYLAEKWREIGVDVMVTAVDKSNIQQNCLIPRSYDVLVTQLQLGADSDVYAYWHSSNIKPQGLNFANYSSPVVDMALFGGRTALSSATRETKTKSFVEQWLIDIPAIALYQPNLYYLHSPNVKSITSAPLVDATSRYRDVYLWTVETRNLYKTP